MILTPEGARRSVDAIFQHRDERAIALLRVTSETLTCRGGIELLNELQDAYVSELVILPLVQACERQHLAPVDRQPARLSVCTNVAVALESAPPTSAAECDVYGGWWLDGREASLERPRLEQQTSDFPWSVPTSAIGWIAPSHRETFSPRHLSTKYELGQRQFFLDLNSTESSNLPIRPQLLAEILCDTSETVGGFVLNHSRGNVDAGRSNDAAQRCIADPTRMKAMLAQIAYAVTLSKITKSTRTNRSIWKGL